ncbi:DNA-processing protein DprA [Bacteroides sp. 224]|uniref:DNA-processing protein DprA n=1 Tax=Bacteroides sp. 224 TaxID=2302936 RepID=UPI0013D3EA2B|nr:DNA-processing protein DprA [Bacteroides sp. 224]NDV63678.1 DNA-protecting protein DprA [Bacteroides sp. 224]
MNEEEIIYSIALTQVPGIGSVWGKNLLTTIGNATTVFRERENLQKLMPGITPRLIDLLNCPDAIKRAEQEYKFIEKNHIQCLTLNSEQYPSRLCECDDAPIVLYYKGNADLNSSHIINMVGTRHATDYGKQLCIDFLKELRNTCPDTIVVSGLAYGIDIHAHRSALTHGFSTIGVLAHGLDRIYPSAHRDTAIKMLDQGGLLTEYISGTNPDKYNFVSRNRIVAGISDATIVVESAEKGGSLITASIAESYNRDCFAFPGRSTDEVSKGCNQLIRDNKASLIQSAEDFIQFMQWNSSNKASRHIQFEIFPDLSEEEQAIIDILKKNESTQINTLSVESNIPIHRINALLLDLEIKGMIQIFAGGKIQAKTRF